MLFDGHACRILASGLIQTLHRDGATASIAARESCQSVKVVSGSDWYDINDSHVSSMCNGGHAT